MLGGKKEREGGKRLMMILMNGSFESVHEEWNGQTTMAQGHINQEKKVTVYTLSVGLEFKF